MLLRASGLFLRIRTARHHFNLDKVIFTDIQKSGDLLISLVGGNDITLRNEEAKQVLDYLDSISTPAWALEVPEEEFVK